MAIKPESEKTQYLLLNQWMTHMIMMMMMMMMANVHWYGTNDRFTSPVFTGDGVNTASSELVPK